MQYVEAAVVGIICLALTIPCVLIGAGLVNRVGQLSGWW